jgi:hypothetical protein
MTTSTQTATSAIATPAQQTAAASRGFLQRKCDCGNHTMGGVCDDCSREKGLLHRWSGRDGESPAVPPVVSEVLRSSGQPLDPRIRSTLEHRLGNMLIARTMSFQQ